MSPEGCFYPAQSGYEVEIEIKHSRFITQIAHTPDPESARQFLEQVRQKHPKANHNCWAQIAGSRDDLNCWGSNDDGEPKGTAGKPMLNVLEHSNLCEITVVVTRYFGGIKLGAGGLVRAYSQAVQEGIKALPCTEKIEQHPFLLCIPHTLVGEIEQLLSKHQIHVLDRDWSEQLEISGEAPAMQLALFRDALSSYQHKTSYRDEKMRW